METVISNPYSKLVEEFKNPGMNYRGVTLWMLNDRLEKDEVIRQLESFYNAGWGAVITRTFMGLRTMYLSEEWMAITEEIIRKAKDFGMKVWLQEADKNAAAYMPTGISGMEDKFRNLILIRKEKDKPVEEDERLLAIYDDYAFYEKKVVPPGGWKELLCVLDLLNPETVATYLEKAYKPLLRFKDEFGKTVEAIWVDEPLIKVARSIVPALPWTRDFIQLFKEKWGYSILDYLPLLFTEDGEYIKVRHHYWRLLTERFKEAYFKQVYEWCERNGVKFTGHLMGEDTLFRQVTWSGTAMSYYEFMGIPGIDFLTADLSWPSGDPFLLPPKQCSSVAHQLGKKEVLCEMYGVSPQGINFEDRKRIANWLMVLGISYRCYHGSFYSMRGRRKRFYPPHLSYQQPYWKYNRLIADYFARVSYMLRQGNYYADILVIHPIESAQCVFTDGEENKAIKELNDSLVLISKNLMSLKRSFDYGDESLLEKYGDVKDGSLVVGKMQYKVVILPSLMTIRRSTFNLLNNFIKGGGKVISVGDLPTRIDGELSSEVDDLNRKVIRVENSIESLKKLLDSYLPKEIDILTKDDRSIDNIWIHHRSLELGDLFFIVNVSETQEYKTVIRIPGRGRLELWNLESGDVTILPQREIDNCITTELEFYPASSYLLLLNKRESSINLSQKELKLAKTIHIGDVYKINRLDPNALTLDFCRYRKEDGEWSEILPIIGIQELLVDERYEGPISLRFEFICEDKPEKVFLVVEDAEKYEIRVNNKKVKYNGLPYYRDISFHPIDISSVVKKGKNIIEMSTYFVAGDPNAQRDLERLYGTELEAIYLIGDFAVKGERRRVEGKSIWYKPEFVICREVLVTDGDLLASGYPFFSGTISLFQSFELSTLRENNKVFLEVEKLYSVVTKVRVNGMEAGVILWKPYKLNITDFVKEGANSIEFELTNSLRNLLGPHHNTLGETSSVWNYSFSGRNRDGEKWLEKRKEGRCISWTDDYCFVPFGISNVNIAVYSEQY
ncbi:hypothetical protein H5T89_11185 [bacterium]|nr:hypothetical protein [bacterium]